MDISSKARESYKRQLSFRVNISKITAAGLAVIASDTGRVLMLQRALTEDDPAGGRWEFPGGRLDPGETSFDAAMREWSEETGLNLPLNAKIQGDWIAPSGRYQLFIYRITQEQDIELNLDHEDRHVSNPDDPDGDEIEVIAWWSLEDLPTNPALREEVKNTDWKIFQNTFIAAAGPCCRPQGGGTGCGNPNCKAGWQAKEKEILENADPRVRKDLDRMLTARREVESQYTGLLSGVVKKSDGKLLGLAFKFKDAQGIVDKIERKVVEKGITHEKSADSIADALRYTVALSPDNYVSGMKNAVKALIRSGDVEFESFENNWQPGDAYNGVNAVFRDKKTGLKIELQFHTPESFIVKDKVNHKNYELIREKKGTALERFQAFMSMKSKSDAVQFPVDVANLEGFGIPIKSVFRPFDEPIAIAAAGTPISKVLSWNEAERLSTNGTMTQGDWEDFVDSALGYGGGFELLPNKKNTVKLQSSTIEFANPCHAPDSGRFCESGGIEKFTGKLPIDIIKPSMKYLADRPNNSQKKLEDDIHKVGVLKPIDIVYESVNGKLGYYIRDGHHRWAAAKAVGLTEIPVKIESKVGSPPALTAAVEFGNPCNLPESGRFGEKGACGSVDGLPQRGGRYKDVVPAKRGGKVYGTPEHDAVINAKQGDSNSSRGSSEEIEAAKVLAKRKIQDAPVPTKERIRKARQEMQLARKGELRPGGENRGSSYDRRNSKLSLFDEFGGFSRGYVVDYETGLKLSWADGRKQIPDENGVLRDNPDHVFNPHNYPTFERGRIFIHFQGGGYQIPNLLPESFSTNRSRGSRPIRKENRK